MSEPDASDLVPTELTPDQPSFSPGAIALQAEKLGTTDQLRRAISGELDREVARCRDAAQVHYEQAVLWRGYNLGIGLSLGVFVAASGAAGLLAKNSWAAAVLAAFATFLGGALTTLNAGQRKTQASAAGAAYRELESEARRLRYVELPYVSLADALTKLRAITARRMSLQKVAEPPSPRAFGRADRNLRDRLEYGYIRTFGQRHRIVFWVPNAMPASTSTEMSARPDDNGSDNAPAPPGPAEAAQAAKK